MGILGHFLNFNELSKIDDVIIFLAHLLPVSHHLSIILKFQEITSGFSSPVNHSQITDDVITCHICQSFSNLVQTGFSKLVKFITFSKLVKFIAFSKLIKFIAFSKLIKFITFSKLVKFTTFSNLIKIFQSVVGVSLFIDDVTFGCFDENFVQSLT